MKIATFNANSIRARLDVVVDWLQQHEPDILAIQETKVVDELFPVEAFENAGYHVVFKGQKAYNGVAIASREKATDVRYGLHDGGPADESRLISAKIGPVRMINTYVPQGRELDHEMYQYKLNWFKRLKKHFDKNFSTRMKLVWVGDLNVAREAMDIHNAEKQTNHVCYHVDVRNAFTDTMGWGFEDVFRKHCPEPGQYTFYDYRANSLKRGAGWRIDYVLATPSLARRSRTAYIDLEPRKVERPSDHTVLVAEFDL